MTWPVIWSFEFVHFYFISSEDRGDRRSQHETNIPNYNWTVTVVVKATLCNFDCNPWPIEKSNWTMHFNMLHKAAISVKSGQILCRKCPPLPLVSYDCSASTLWFMEVPESNISAAWYSRNVEKKNVHAQMDPVGLMTVCQLFYYCCC